jgi:hypothetical protein
MAFVCSANGQEKALSPAVSQFLNQTGGGVIHMSESVQVSASNAQLNHSEVIMAADPSNKDHLLACSMVVPRQPSTEFSRIVAYVSFDGGRAWSASLELKGGLWASDPSCAFYVDGNPYYTAMVFDSVQGKYKGKTVLYGSSNGGKTWSLVSTFPLEGDREFLTIDGRKKRIYMVERFEGRSLK